MHPHLGSASATGWTPSRRGIRPHFPVGSSNRLSDSQLLQQLPSFAGLYADQLKQTTGLLIFLVSAPLLFSDRGGNHEMPVKVGFLPPPRSSASPPVRTLPQQRRHLAPTGAHCLKCGVLKLTHISRLRLVDGVSAASTASVAAWQWAQLNSRIALHRNKTAIGLLARQTLCGNVVRQETSPTVRSFSWGVRSADLHRRLW